jgi:perosamine synthetase
LKEIVPGAPPAEGVIPLAVPDLGDEERRLVDDSLHSGWIAYGPYVDRFEEDVAKLLGAQHVVAVGSGTAALHLALLVAGVQPDEEVIVSTLSFISPAFAIRYVGAWPVFIDAEPQYWQIDVEKLAAFLQEECERDAGGVLRNRTSGRRIAALLPVGILGHPFDADAVRALATEFGLPIVEDAAETLGARYRDRPAGTLGDIGCLSFNGNKIVTCGGGGMVVTNDARTAERVRYLATQAKDDPLEYVHGEVGFNYRLANPMAAIGCGQLAHLAEFVEVKRRIQRGYEEGLADVPGVSFQQEAEWAFGTEWLASIRFDEAEYGVGSRELMGRLLDAGIQVRPFWQPLHLSPSMQGAQAYRCDEAEGLAAESLMVPCSVSLTDEQQARVVEEIRRHATIG